MIRERRQDFVCVRMTRMNGVNLNKFEFDYDTTWAAFFADADLNLFSRYGGRDHGEPDARINRQSLLHTMSEVSTAHQLAHGKPGTAYQPLADEQSDRLVQATREGVVRADDIPLLKQSHQGCIHCHEVAEYRLLQAANDDTFRREQLFGWPLPENLGITNDLQHGHRVQAVQPGSAADEGGLQAGDVIVAVNSTPVRSELDLRWVMHRSPAGKPLEFEVRRTASDRLVQRVVHPPRDWKQTDLGWRKSLRSVPLELGIRGYSLTRSQRRKLALPAEEMAIKLVSVRDRGLAKALGVRQGDIIRELGGRSRNGSFERFLSDLLRQFQPGDTVRMVVLRGADRVELSGRFPDWKAVETALPQR